MTDAGARELWGSFRGHIRSFLARRVRNPADVDDLVQEVFLRIHRRIGTVKSTALLEPWIHRIARNVLIDHYRSTAARRAPSAPPSGEPTAESLVPDDLDQVRGGLTRCLSPMVERLEPKYRDAISLVEFGGVSQAEAAARLGLSLSGTKSRVQRGRGQLKAMLLDCCHVELDRRGGIVDYAPRGICDCAQPGATCARAAPSRSC